MAAGLPDRLNEFLVHQPWCKPFRFEEELYYPLPLEAYSTCAHRTWSQEPLFCTAAKEIVRLCKVFSPSFPTVCQVGIFKNSPQRVDYAHDRTDDLLFIIKPYFNYPLGYYADLAAGKPPRPLRIEHGAPLPPGWVPHEVEFFNSEKSAWEVLTTVPYSECRKDPQWDGLPIFMNSARGRVRLFKADPKNGVCTTLYAFPCAVANTPRFTMEVPQIGEVTFELVFNQPLEEGGSAMADLSGRVGRMALDDEKKPA